jgi:coatomer protein complex subunit gamma
LPRAELRVQVIAESGPSSHGETRPFYDYLEGCLRHKSEMVMFEAAKAICNMPDATSRELMSPIVVCQLFLSSSKPYLRFASVSLTRHPGNRWDASIRDLKY